MISSAGPLNNIFLNDNLACNVNHVGDTANEFYGGTNPGACGTFLAVGSTVYGPNVPAGIGRAQYTVVSQTAVTGSGTSADPYSVTTVVNVDNTGLQISQTDSYVVGTEFYRTDITVSNSSPASITAALYHAGDCYLGNDDRGFGFYDSSAGGIYCSKTANNSPPDRIEGFVPQSPGSNYLETGYSSVWGAINGNQFSNFCACGVFQDNGAGLSWSITVPAGGSVTRSLLSNFSPTGVTPAQIVTTLSGGGQSGASITVPRGTGVKDSATLTGPNAGTASGTVTYTVYSDSSCSTVFATGGTKTIANGSVPDSDTVPFNQSGTFYWRASYSGDPNNAPVTSACGAETLTVTGDEPITAHGTTVNATEGASFSGRVATFDDPDTSATASEYSATIDWGDGTSTSAGTISGSGGTFAVDGTHTYTEEGSSYAITVVITDVDNTSNTDTAHSTANVADAPLASQCVAPATSLKAFAGPTATFTDADPNGTSTDYTATIDWGDSSSSSGTVSPGTGSGPYAVSGAHTYSSTGSFTITTTIKDVGGSQTVATCSTLVFAFAPGGGSFVIGDQNSATGSRVTFWGAQWWKKNLLTGGTAPAAFKGYAKNPAQPSCGTGWSTDPGNSAPPPNGPLPADMGVIVSSKITKSGSQISGNTVHIVVVRTNPGYQPDPGHEGTGTVEAQVC